MGAEDNIFDSSSFKYMRFSVEINWPSEVDCYQSPQFSTDLLPKFSTS